MVTRCKRRKSIAIGIVTMLFLCGCTRQKTTFVETSSPAEETLSECILEFHGTIPVNGASKTLDLYYCHINDHHYAYEIFIDGNMQTFPLREDFEASTVTRGYEIQDVNQDGQEDILIELGLYGKCMPWACFVYSEDSRYVAVPGFDELMIPHWSDKHGMVVEEWNNGSTQYAINRYRVIGNDLILTESLFWEYTDGNMSGYTIKKRVDGEMKVIRDKIKESEINLDDWYS